MAESRWLSAGTGCSRDACRSLGRILRTFVVGGLIAGGFAAGAGDARADDRAAEADLHFEIGKELYKAGEFRGALQQFLASNRMAPNRNVAFNIASCYEQLGRYPEAHSYYTQVLATEKDPQVRAALEAGLLRIAPHVVVLQVDSEPPGATIYVNRKDLGARGETPRTLALAPGSYELLLERPGYEPIKVPVGRVEAGTHKPLTAKLTSIVGTVSVQTSPAGVNVRVGSATSAVVATAPAAVTLPTGIATLFLDKQGYDPVEVPVRVPPNGNTTIHPRLLPQRGNLVVQADLREAPIEVDGQVVGFTPAVIPVRVGKRKVRVVVSGLRPFDEVVTIEAGKPTHLNLNLAAAEEVTAASRTAEAVEDAPTSVSIIGARELRAMQYPTIAEALRGTRGIYLTDDRSYTFLGVRGFSRTSDYGNKVLILQDGHPLNDNLLVQSFPGFDGRVDLGDVERIEVIRGPGSVMYGTGAFFGVVNLVTRSRETPTKAEASISSVETGVLRGRVMGNLRLGKSGNVWTSVAAAKSDGREFYFPEYANESPHFGYARNNDGFKAGTVNGRLSYGDFTMQWFYTRRDKRLPTAVYETLFADPRLRYVDTRGLVEARFEPYVLPTLQALTRVHANLYQFRAELPYDPADDGMWVEDYEGLWAGFEERLIWMPSDTLRLTFGGEAQRHFEATMTAENDAGNQMDVAEPYTTAAGYGVVDVEPIEPLRFSLGIRVDYFSTVPDVVLSPRAAVILKPYQDGTAKLMAGTAFRSPSIYELYYQNVTQAPSPDLEPERVSSLELELGHRFNPVTLLTVASYVNRVSGLTVGRGGGTEDDPFSIVNSTVPVMAFGGEAEVRRDWQDGWMVAANYAIQRVEYTGDDEGLREVPNAPTHLGSIRGGFPIVGKSLSAMSRLSLESGRWDRNETSVDDPQKKTAGAAIWDLVFSGEAGAARYAFGVYNAGDVRYSVPISGEYVMRKMRQNGRTFLFSLGVEM